MTDRDEEILAELLLRWEELRERGQDTPAAELCQEHPHLAEELARRIKALKAVSWMDKPLGPGDDGSDPPGSSPATPKTLLGRYRLDDLIATGGFAQVWRGYDLELQRVVAVKVPRPSRLRSADSFMAEARRVARLKHPGIVPVFDVGHDGDACFIVSEFVEGGSLGDQLSRNPPTQQQAVRWIAEIADALEYAHLHGVVHRDIKPANILIDHHGRALLADFGIAQSANKAGQEALSLGTLRYMSPEQLEGRDVDARSDIFSLGVVLHEALTGKLPYSSVEPNILRREIVAGAKVGAEKLPADLKQICEKSLARSPHQRHTSAAHLAAELRKCIEASPKSTGKLLAVIVPVISLAVGAAIWWQSLQRAAQPPAHGAIPQVKQTEDFDSWLKRVASLPAKSRAEAVLEKICELNPDFQPLPGRYGYEIAESEVVQVRFFGADNLKDISPLRALPTLTSVRFNHCFQLEDISPLEEMDQLKELEIFQTNVSDLTPLKGKPLTRLMIGYSYVNDLRPLEGMKLEYLDAHVSHFTSLKPLAGMPLTTLMLNGTKVDDLSPLKGMKLKVLNVYGTPVKDLSPLTGMPIELLRIGGTKASDYSVLKEMPLKDLGLDFKPERDTELLKSITTLETINEKPVDEFWKEVEPKKP